MNIEKIKYFIDLVECKNFTETAKKNFVSQTTISQQIASIEKAFDLKLIDRKHMPIEPTSAGWTFYREALVIWKQYNRMQKTMLDFKRNQPQLLSVAYTTMTDIQSLLPHMPKVNEKHPHMRLDLTKVTLKDMTAYLEKGLYDLAIAVDSAFVGNDQIVTQTLYSGRYCAVVSRKHPLFNHETISKEELYKHPLIMLHSNTIGNTYHLMIEHAIEDGYEPNIVRTVEDVETELFHILTDQVIGFFPDNYQLNHSNDELRLIPLKDSKHTFKIVIGYLKGNDNPALTSFMNGMPDWFSQ